MTKKFRKIVYSILCGFMTAAAILGISAMTIIEKGGMQGFRESYYGQIVSIASGIWCVAIVITLVSIVGIRYVKGDYH